MFIQVSAGIYHTCGLNADGTIACWGSNADGQSTAAGTFVAVAAGLHTCGVKADGTLACWGNDFYGQSTPPAGTFTQVTTGGYHTCGLKTNAALVCWGDNSRGQVDMIFKENFE
jgi:alpha-tubulin suppressor-like RCC1 family protein